MQNDSQALAPLKPIDHFKQEIVLRKESITKRLPAQCSWEKYQGIVEGAVMNNMDLLECDRKTLLLACLDAAALGLDLNKSMAEADILKVWNGKTRRSEAQFRPRYKGLMKLALQSGEVLKIESRLIYENDEFEIVEGTSPYITHKRKLGNRGEKIGAYCTWTLRNGEVQFEVMSADEILAIRNRSSSKNKNGDLVGPWVTDEAEMWRKTVVRRATKYMPMSPEVARAIHIDNVAEGIVDADDFAGHVSDITDIDDGPMPTPEPEVAERQVASLEERVTRAKAAPQPEPEPEHEPEVSIDYLHPIDDDDGLPDWDAWSHAAYGIVSDLGASLRKEWADVHADLLAEAEMMAPKSVANLMKLF